MATSRRKERQPSVSGDLQHLMGCPERRVEAYHDYRPPKPDQGLPRQPVTITRCIECGAQIVEAGHLWTGADTEETTNPGGDVGD